MRAFLGQLSGLGLQATQAGIWVIPPFYIKAFHKAKLRLKGLFQGYIE